MNPHTPSTDFSAADRCVKCGLCLPHCPTFALTGNEADSPRGRISLMQMIATTEVVWSEGLFTHLDSCLQCRACEAMCPSKVPYGELMDQANIALEARRQRSAAGRWLRRSALDLAASPARLRWFGRLLGLYRLTGMKAVLSRLPGAPPWLRRANTLLPAPPRRVVRRTADGARTGTVSLFQGCTGNLFDRHTLAASQILLQELGFQVLIPRRQSCCGALHRHNADEPAAQRLLQTNLRAFDPRWPVIGISSACSAHLGEYATTCGGTEEARFFASQVTDILHFLLQQSLEKLDFAPLAEKVAVYVPCTQRNVLKQQNDLVDSLNCIPAIDTQLVNPQGGCCGAAGSYLLSQPEFSDRLSTKAVDAIVASGAQRVVTSNIGCSLQLQAGLRARGLDIEVLHPVVLLQRQLVDTGR